MPFAYGVSEFTTMPWSFEKDVEHYAALGVQAIELCEQKLDKHRYEAQLGAVADHGLTVSGVQPLVRTFFASRMQVDPVSVQDRADRFRRSIERLARFAPGAPFICNTGAQPKGDMAEAMAVVVRELRALAPIAAEHGVRIALEPLNPTSVNVESAIWTVAQALDIIEATGRDEIGLCLDYWNIWQNADIEAQIRRAGDRIFTVQASDWRTPRSFADRIAPGDGYIPLGRLLQATYAAGYRGACTVEVFSVGVSDSLYDDDLDALIRRSRAGLDQAWRSGLAPAPPPMPAPIAVT
jgi:sugar phosphate isomerase/epimerase